MKKSVFLVVIALLVLILSACGEDNNPADLVLSRNLLPVSYGNGVYYFPYTGKKFSQSLSKFIANGNKVVVMTGDGGNAFGFDVGYFVVVDTTVVKEIEK